MIYLDSFRFPDGDWEWKQRLKVKRTCYNTMYPFGILSGIGLERLDFAPVTILYRENDGAECDRGKIAADAGYAGKYFDLFRNLCAGLLGGDGRGASSREPHDYQRRCV